MKFEVGRIDLLKSVSLGQSIIERRTTIPALTHICLHVTNGLLHLAFTNLDIELSLSLPVTTVTEGTICLPGQILYDIIRKTKSDHVTLSLQEDTSQVEIKAGRSTFMISALSADEFPHIDGFESQKEFRISPSDIKFLIDQTRPFMCDDPTHYTLNGIYIHMSQENHLRAVSTDSHRLACVECSLANSEHMDDFEGIILGKKTILEFRKLLEESDHPVIIRVGHGRFEAHIQTPFTKARFSSRLIEGKFPDYQETLSLDMAREFTINTKEFLQTVDRISTILTEGYKAVRLDIRENEIILRAVNNQMGTAEDAIEMDFPYAEQYSICLNSNYLLDILKTIKSDELRFCFVNDQAQIIIKPSGDELFERYLLMPLID